MRNVFYDSDSLGKSVYIADIQSLARNDLNVLERELNVAISNMRTKMHEERDTTELDWLHKLSVKLKICEQFMTRIKQVKENDLSNQRVGLARIQIRARSDRQIRRENQDATSQSARSGSRPF